MHKPDARGDDDDADDVVISILISSFFCSVNPERHNFIKFHCIRHDGRTREIPLVHSQNETITEKNGSRTDNKRLFV